MKLEPAVRTGALLAKLAEACEVNLPPLALQDSQLMTWDQIRQVAQDKIVIGSHTHTHRVLATLDGDTQQEELALSKAILEREIGQPVRSIAYPVGGLRHFTEQTEQLAKASGYALTFSYRTGLNGAANLAICHIKRASGPQQLSLVPAMSVFPKFFIEGEDASRYHYDYYA
jgi:peptidoglycan/xylan/chitin deacetylase (PgdA/CDA1 family)